MIAIALLLLASDSQVPPIGNTPETADYDCGISRTLNYGDLNLYRPVAFNGQTRHISVGWHTTLRPSLRFSVVWHAPPGGRVDTDRGIAMFDWQVGKLYQRDRKRSDYSIEIRATRGPTWEGNVAFSSDQALYHGVWLAVDWADLRAMLKGNRTIYIILKDRKGRILDTTEMGAEWIDPVMAEALALQAQSDEKALDFRNRCESTYTDDVII